MNILDNIFYRIITFLIRMLPLRPHFKMMINLRRIVFERTLINTNYLCSSIYYNFPSYDRPIFKELYGIIDMIDEDILDEVK